MRQEIEFLRQHESSFPELRDEVFPGNLHCHGRSHRRLSFVEVHDGKTATGPQGSRQLRVIALAILDVVDNVADKDVVNNVADEDVVNNVADKYNVQRIFAQQRIISGENQGAARTASRLRRLASLARSFTRSFTCSLR